MGRRWTLHDAPRRSSVATGAVVGLLQDVNALAPGDAALRFLSRLVPLEYLSLVEYPGHAPPRQIEGHAVSQAAQETTARCFALYRRHAFFRLDDATGLAADLARIGPEVPQVDVLHYRQREIPDPVWREAIFERERLAGRVSLLFAGAAGSVFALNLYRDTAAGEFGADELARLRAVAPLLRAVLRQRLQAQPADVAERVAATEARVAQRAPALSARERAVAARIACGVSNDGIAADLGVAPSTVITLRKRVYTKLAIHSRIALVWLLR